MADAGAAAAAPLAPTGAGERIAALDVIRGVAVLGILTMNAVGYGLTDAAYWNIGAGGIDTRLDWVIGGAGEIFFDQKFMGLFSMLFGASIVLFADRAAARERRANWLSFWRNLLLLGIGVLHMLLWDGDVLVLYAVCSVFLLALRKRSPRALLVLGVGMMVGAAALAIAAQQWIGADGAALEGYWKDGAMSDALGSWFAADAFLRALGMMLIGVAFYRTGVITGERSPAFYRRAAVWGLVIGLPLAAGGFAFVAVGDFSPDAAIAGTAPNTLATFPLALAYLSVIALWSLRPATALRRRVSAVGRMALTNYLTQTIIGVLVLEMLFDPDDLSRSWLVLFIVAVWGLQLWWSQAWLARFRYGPFEWAWRCATYRRWQPLRGAAA